LFSNSLLAVVKVILNLGRGTCPQAFWNGCPVMACTKSLSLCLCTVKWKTSIHREFTDHTFPILQRTTPSPSLSIFEACDS
jgi:hypothetical protein